jgi:type IV pilus assembly protein PilC
MAADTYAYRVRDRAGALLAGTLEADSVPIVVARLRELGYIPLSVEKRAASGLQTEVRIPGLRRRIKTEALSVFSRQFATMIDSGLTLLRALAVLAEQTESPMLAEVLRTVRLDVEQGSSLSQALARHPKTFPRIYVAMVKAGETGGGLDRVLVQLADTMEKQVGLQRKIKSAMAYPIGVLCLVFAILAAMLIFIVPTFKSMYASLGGTLPLPTRILMKASSAALILVPLTIIAAIGAVFAFRRAMQTERGRMVWDTFKLRVPVFGKLVHQSALARMARTMSSLVRSGVPLIECLEITKDTSGNTVVANALSDVQEGVRGGDSIARRLANHAVVPPMVTVGEESGSVDTMLEKVALFYESRVEALVNSLTSLLEPVLVVILGGLVGSMVISLYLPMFKIINLVH